MNQKKPKRAQSEKMRPSIFWVLAFFVRPLFGLLASIHIDKKHNLPKQGPVILVSNHYTAIDPVVVGIAMWKMGRLPRFLVKESLFRVPVLGHVMRWSGQIPVARGTSRSNASLELAKGIIDHDQSVIIYPEGTLTKDPDCWPMKGKTGAARMALEHRVTVVPIAHWGAQRVLGRYSKKISLFPRKRVDVAVGPPIDFSDFLAREIDQDVLNKATERIMSEITTLLRHLRNEEKK